MRSRLLNRCSPSLLLSCLALFVALGGTSYAVSQLPKNSVGPNQLRKNAVNSTKVKDGSLLAKDFKAGQLPAGAQGKPGPSHVYGAYRDLISPPPLPAGTTTTVMTLSVPAGKYAIAAKLGLDDANSGGPRTATCTLQAGTDFDVTHVTMDGVGGFPCSTLLLHEFASSGSVLLRVTAPSGSLTRAGYGKITAIKVGAISNTAVNG